MEEAISKAYDYILAVITKQERWLTCNDLWKGYQSLVPKQLTKHGFETLYNSMREV